jgi:FtsZ-binding cell division protein ZapB
MIMRLFGYEEGHIAGATSYATKLLTAEEKIKILEYDNTRLKGELEGYKEAYDEVVKDRYRLSQENDECMKNYNKLNEQATGWRPLLEEVLNKHNTGKLPDHHIYEKIKRFLYGND